MKTPKKKNQRFHLRRYKEPLRVGRQKFDGSYTSHLGNVPIYSRKTIPENLKANQRISSSDVPLTETEKEDIAWFRENWDELDLIDPQKFAIFPGDVVVIVNKSHSKLYLILAKSVNTFNASSRLELNCRKDILI